MPSDELEYLRACAAEERKRAADGADANFRALHLDFALRYERAIHNVGHNKVMRMSQGTIEQSNDLLRATRVW